MAKSTLAALQIGSSPQGKEATLEKILSFEDRIIASGARLVVMPEALLGGYPKGEIFGTRLGYRLPQGRETYASYYANAIDVPGAETAADRWWTVRVPVRNPTLSYRFLVSGRPSPYAWLNGAGLWFRDVPDGADFRLTTAPAPPAWARDAVVYQIFPDRFARSAGAADRPLPPWALPARWDDEWTVSPDTCAQVLYGGDLDGIADHLDHVESLGADTVYLTPVFPGGSTHRYDAATFDHVDPLLGGDEALARLAAACHARGLRLLGDLTTNHTGVGHDWFRAALAPTGASITVVRPHLGDALPLPGRFGAAVVSGAWEMVTDRLDWSERTGAWLIDLVARGLLDARWWIDETTFGWDSVAEAFQAAGDRSIVKPVIDLTTEGAPWTS